MKRLSGWDSKKIESLRGDLKDFFKQVWGQVIESDITIYKETKELLDKSNVGSEVTDLIEKIQKLRNKNPDQIDDKDKQHIIQYFNKKANAEQNGTFAENNLGDLFYC